MKKNIIQNKMDIYSKKQKWKFALLGFAIIIGASSLFVTNHLVRELKEEERKKIELWADATRHATEGGDYLALKIMRENTNIPVLVVDDRDSIILSRNFDSKTKLDKFFISIGFMAERKSTYSYLYQQLDLIRASENEPIRILISEDGETSQWIYYKDSALLSRLRYYPIYQLVFISIFMFIAYFTFSASRKSEQNQVWAGMAKETAHQLATPVSSLMAWIELLKGKEGVKNMVEEMGKDIKRLDIITDRFSKIGSQAELLNKDIVSLVNQSIEYLKARMPVNTQFTIDVPNKEIVVPINSALFEWAIENLVKNAVDAIKGKGKISIEIIEDTMKVIINITDNGEGIDKSIVKNIFKPGVTSKKRGWGLGLSLSKRIVEEYHNGSIFVMQSEKDIGTTFTIHLPKQLKATTS